MGTSRTRTTATIAALTLIVPVAGLSQEESSEAGGLQVDFGVSSSLRFDDNFNLDEGGSPGNSTIWDTTLSFAVASITPTQTLRLEGSSVLRFAELPGDASGDSSGSFEDPNLRFIYAREGADSRLSFDAEWRDQDLDFIDPFDDEETDDDLTGNDGGSLETRRLRLTYEQGANSPVGFSVTAGYDDQNYTDASDPDLVDTTTTDISATISMRVTPTGRLSFTAGRTWEDEDDAVQTERETTDVSVGWQQEVNASTTLNASLGFTDIDTDTLLGTEEESGATALVAIDRSLPNGSATAELEIEQTVNGSRTTLSFGRSLELPRGTLAATAGLTRGESGDLDWIASLDYSYALASDSFTASLDRSVSTDDDDEETVSTSVGLGYRREINQVSSIGVDFAFNRSEAAGGSTGDTTDSASLQATYTHALTEDWDLETGALFRYEDDRGEPGHARSNQIFLTVSRDFSFRP